MDRRSTLSRARICDWNEGHGIDASDFILRDSAHLIEDDLGAIAVGGNAALCEILHDVLRPHSIALWQCRSLQMSGTSQVTAIMPTHATSTLQLQ